MELFQKPPHYRSYLVTFWEERSPDSDRPKVWRFSLEDPRSGCRRGFPDLAALVAALEQELQDRPNGEDQAAQ
jgi:hypothetical protein